MGFSHILLIHHGRPCPYCSTTMKIKRVGKVGASQQPWFPTRDHVIPKSMMPGMGTLIVCRRCNEDKANRTLAQWRTALAKAKDPRAAIIGKFMQDNQHLHFELPNESMTVA